MAPPAQGYYKLNIDGAFDNHSHKVGAGRVFRDASGTWVYGFTKQLRHADILQAELLALYHGLLLANACNFRPLQVETDSQVDARGTPADVLAKHGKTTTDIQPNDVLIFENPPTFAYLF
ncbi:hypothetical protein A4A49_53908 [Nicotiana attenuata]|uniref:RNase H type-1 domain-containing protein n=1 Tax=Nicotiana attenuata TaxID=49451 RepID=A0A314KQT3_NICAT|nr:hypothetical protein A4A49_53908 [Nicotiana attenuata]